jgi:capsular exopolysaccharide synthesis family protein
MSHFFELLQKLQGQTSGSPSTSVSASSQDTEEISEVGKLVVEAFPETKGQSGNSSSVSASSDSGNVDQAGEFQQIPTEEVYLQPESRIVFHTDPRSPGADRFRYLRMRLQDLWDAGKLRSLLVTSPLPEDGKSTIVVNLATALAEGGKRTVLLVEADLHQPTLTHRLGLKDRPGLTECLEGDVNPFSAVRRLAQLGWYLLPAGGPPQSNPTELVQSDALSGVLQELSPFFDWILIDAPPVGPLTDALSLARKADASLLVLRAGRTPREAVDRALALLGPKHVLGIVLNGAEGLNRLYSKYHGYYGSKITKKRGGTDNSKPLVR